MLPEEWYSKARDALTFAVAGFDSSGIPAIACFLSHQAAELAIKGFISERGGQPPRVHDLPRLLLLCNAFDDEIAISEEDALLLNPWYIPGTLSCTRSHRGHEAGRTGSHRSCWSNPGCHRGE